MPSISAVRTSTTLLLAWAFAIGCSVSANGSRGSNESQCRTDSDVICPGDFVGYSCQGESKPSLTCGAGTLQSDGEIGYCCGVRSPGCAVDSTAACSDGSTGYSCTGGVQPKASDPSLSCSAGVLGSNADELYCCVAAMSGTCVTDPDAARCAAGSYGFSCTGSDTPDPTHTSLVCSSSTPGPNDESLYCCSVG